MLPLALIPAANARFAAAWVTGPSATGPEKGTPDHDHFCALML